MHVLCWWKCWFAATKQDGPNFTSVVYYKFTRLHFICKIPGKDYRCLWFCISMVPQKYYKIKWDEINIFIPFVVILSSSIVVILWDINELLTIQIYIYSFSVNISHI